MYRGVATFKCPKCGKVFRGPNVEWNATVLTAPQPCPKCGTESKVLNEPSVESFGSLMKKVKELFGL